MRAAKRPNRAQELMSMTLHSLSGAWPISRPVQRLAGIRRLERNARRWRLRISRWIYEVTGPRYALRLLRYPRRNQVAPDFCVADELSHRWRGGREVQRLCLTSAR